MSRPKKWASMVLGSKESIEDFNAFSDDNAIVWADVQIGCYKEAMTALINGNSNWRMTVTDDQELLIDTMQRRASAQ